MEYIKLAAIVGSVSLDGTLKIISSTDFPMDRFVPGKKLLLKRENEEKTTELTIVSFRLGGKFDFLKTEEITVKEDADALKGYILVIPKEEAILPEGYYHFSDLEKCLLYDQNDKCIGKVLSMEDFASQITIRAESSEGKVFYVPFVDAFILDVDIINLKIKINVIEGMLWKSPF